MIWFDYLGLHRRILKALGFQPWTTKAEMPWYWGWAACYFCTTFWIGIIVAIAWYLTSGDWKTVATFIGLHTIVARVLDNLLGFDSMKSK